MKGLNGFDIPGLHIYRTEKVITRLLIIIFILIVLLTPCLFSCNPALMKVQQHRTLSSAYTHQGKYMKHNSIKASRNSIQKQNPKCFIPSNRK